MSIYAGTILIQFMDRATRFQSTFKVYKCVASFISPLLV